MKYFLVTLLLCGLAGTLAACDTAPSNMLPAHSLTPTNRQMVPSLTQELTQTPVTSSPTVTPPKPTETATPVLLTETSLPDCVTLIYEEYAQVEIIGPAGERVLVDVSAPSRLSSQIVARDILLTTHTHFDHWNEAFQMEFPGKQLFLQAGFLEAPGTIIQGIASAHNHGDRFKPEGGTNYIYLIEVGGLRMAHFGDIGQEALTDEQLIELGKVDIAISQVNNPYSAMNAENRKGINLMAQVQPRLIIPTHHNLDTIKLAVAQWGGYFSETPKVKICEGDLLQDETQFLLMGESVETITRYIDLTAWDKP